MQNSDYLKEISHSALAFTKLTLLFESSRSITHMEFSDLFHQSELPIQNCHLSTLVGPTTTYLFSL